jgi:hypothetical protein
MNLTTVLELGSQRNTEKAYGASNPFMDLLDGLGLPVPTG